MSVPSLRSTQISATGKPRTEGHQRGGGLRSRMVSLARTLGKQREAHDPEQGYRHSALGLTESYHLHKELQLFSAIVRSAKAEAQVHPPTAEWLERVRPIIDAIEALKDAHIPQPESVKWPKSPSYVRQDGVKRAPGDPARIQLH